MDIEKSIKDAKTPGPLYCEECEDEMFSPMDKLSISLYGKCSIHFDEGSHQEKNLFNIVETIF